MAEEAVVDPIDTIGDDVAEESVQEEVTQDSASTSEQPSEDSSEDGRVVETDATSEEPAAPAESTEEVEETSTDTDQEAEKEQPPEPFTYRGDGQVHTIDGSKVGADGSVTIPKDQAPHIQNLLAAGKHHLGNWQRDQAAAKQAVETANTERDGEKAKSDQIVQKFEALMGLDDDALYEQVLQFKAEWPATKAEADKAAIEASHQSDRQRLATYEQRDYERQILPLMETGLQHHVDAIGKDERFSHLTDADRKEVFSHLWSNWKTSNVFVADGNEPKVRLDVVEGALAYAAKFRREQAETEKKTAEAKEANKTETTTEAKKPPPILSTKGGPQPKGKVEGSVVDAIREKYSPEEQTEAADAWFDEEDFADD